MIHRIRLQSGISMIEVLVSILVLSIGLLGMAALMASSLRNSQSANFRSQATNLAYTYVEMMRANVANADNYTRDTFTDPGVCESAAEAPIDIAACPDQQSCDRGKWAKDLCYVLPNGRGRATVTPIGTTGYFNASVEICWADDRSEDTAATTDCDGPGETLFVVDTRI